MKISFDQTVKDFAAFSHYHYSRNWAFKLVRLLFPTIFLCGSAIIIFFWAKGEDMRDMNFSGLAIMGMLSVYFLVRFSKTGFAKRIERFVKKKGNEHYVGPREIEFNDEQIMLHTKLSDFKFSWQAVSAMKETKEYLFLYVASNQGIIIPKRIFLLDQELHDVKSFIERKLSEQTR
jgi:hypothetical protein